MMGYEYEGYPVGDPHAALTALLARVEELEADLKQARETAAFWKAGYERDSYRVKEENVRLREAHAHCWHDGMGCVTAGCPQPTESESYVVDEPGLLQPYPQPTKGEG